MERKKKKIRVVYSQVIKELFRNMGINSHRYRTLISCALEEQSVRSLVSVILGAFFAGQTRAYI